MAKDKSSGGGKNYRDAGTGQFVTKNYADKASEDDARRDAGW